MPPETPKSDPPFGVAGKKVIFKGGGLLAWNFMEFHNQNLSKNRGPSLKGTANSLLLHGSDIVNSNSYMFIVI